MSDTQEQTQTQKEQLEQLFVDMIADDKKSIDIARTILTKQMITDDDLTDLNDKQIICLSILEAVTSQIDVPFLVQLIKSFKKLRKSKNRNDRKEIVKMVQALREEQEGIQSKIKDLLGVGQ